MTNFIQWLITSSEDPNKISMTMKSIAAFAVLFGLDTTVVNDAQNNLVSIITALGMLVSAGTALWGLGRKIKNGQWRAPSYTPD